MSQPNYPPGKEISQARKDAINARWGDVIQSYPPQLRGKVNQYRVALNQATLDTDALSELIDVQGGTLNSGL